MIKKIYTFIIALIVTASAIAQPTVAATDPTALSADVLSVYSNTYTNLAGTDFFPNWGQSTIVTDFPIGGNDTKKLTAFNYQGIVPTATINLTAASMQNVHIDVWSPAAPDPLNATAVKLFLINPGPVEYGVTLTLTTSGWNSFDVPLSTFSSNGINLSNVFQIKLEAVPFSYPTGVPTVYYDNLYFWKAANAPTLSGFSIPAQLVGASPLTITPPTSNSTGAFTYTSSNTGVATVSGNMLTIIGAGTSTITANQAAAGAYGAGSINTPLVVSYPGPTVAATDPTAAAADVISVYSNTYTDLAGTDFFPNWGQSTVVTDYAIGTNTIKKMDNFNYQGTQFAAPINASTMQNLHIDLWTPNATAFELYLINAGPVEQKVTVTPNNTGWNSFDIPLSSYTAINMSSIIQFKYVSVPSGTTVYYDNVYFWKAANVPTLSAFTVPAQVVGASPVTITPPTSNSAGAFTYTSSNTAVATISGNLITIVGAGTSTITANQAADGIYGAGSITTPLVVTYAPPMTAAPAPPTLTTPNVLSLFSEAFPVLNGSATTINWNPFWGQSTTVSDVMVASNNTRLYNNLNYQGVEFSTPIDVTSYNKLHLDIWTPNCTSFKVFLISLSPTIEQAVTLTPNNTGWNSFDIDMSLYRPTAIVNLSALAQMKFEGTPSGTSTVYMDNLYFYNSIGLPITLSKFTATNNKNTVQLNWTTQTEINNKGFNVQRSVDGINFSTIGSFVNGKGNYSGVSNYTALDNLPNIGSNFYRLQQVDFDSKLNYSSVVNVRVTKNNLLGFSFYPNPVKNNINITVGIIDQNNAYISLINNVGQQVRFKNLSKSTANSTTNFDISNLAKGTYFIALYNGLNKTVEKLVIN